MIALLFLLAGADWEVVEDKDGVTVETRTVPKNKLDEIRVRTHTALPIQKLCDVVWGNGKLDPDEPGLKSRELLEDKGNERLAYEQISAPIVSDRDYTILSKRIEDKATGVCQIFFETKNDRGPAPKKDHVRIPLVYGSWTFEPSEGGGTDITYFIYSEPGGSIPVFMVKGAQRTTAKKWLAMVLKKAS